MWDMTSRSGASSSQERLAGDNGLQVEGTGEDGRGLVVAATRSFPGDLTVHVAVHPR